MSTILFIGAMVCFAIAATLTVGVLSYSYFCHRQYKNLTGRYTRGWLYKEGGK